MKKILIIDDDMEYRDIMGIIAKNKGWQAVTVTEWADVRDQILNQEFSIIICDFKLRQRTALELLEFMNVSGVMIPTFVVTASDEESYREKTLNAGAKEFYDKLDLHVNGVYELLEKY